MKHFFLFLSSVFGLLFFAVLMRSQRSANPILRVYAKSSFTSQWGPGPWLKEGFEKSCNCHVEYYDSADALLLLQRLKSEEKNLTPDLVLGFDQYDLEMVEKEIRWRKIRLQNVNFVPALEKILNQFSFIPYDWGVLSFVTRGSEHPHLPRSFQDLLSPELSNSLAVEDPRTSSVGMQFLLWLVRIKGEDKAFEYLKTFNKQVKVYANSWSMANGLFQRKQVKTYFSYTTTPVYYLTEEKDRDVVALEFTENHPIQVEYLGIPQNCRNCDLAERFTAHILSLEGQRVIMEKNYMFPAVSGVKEGTAFALVPQYNLLEALYLPSLAERERLLKKWAQIRRTE